MEKRQNDVRRLAFEILDSHAIESKEFARLMRKLLKNFFILPFRLIDGGNIEPRARFELDLGEFDTIKLPNSMPSLILPGKVDLMK